MTVRTITLTDAVPVRIEEDNWPVIAEASGPGFCDLETTQNDLVVREHQDGRFIVYAVRQLDDQYHRAGRVLDDGLNAEELPPYIHNVGEEANVPIDIRRRCIADLPPVDLG